MKTCSPHNDQPGWVSCSRTTDVSPATSSVNTFPSNLVFSLRKFRRLQVQEATYLTAPKVLAAPRSSSQLLQLLQLLTAPSSSLCSRFLRSRLMCRATAPHPFSSEGAETGRLQAAASQRKRRTGRRAELGVGAPSLAAICSRQANGEQEVSECRAALGRLGRLGASWVRTKPQTTESDSKNYSSVRPLWVLINFEVRMLTTSLTGTDDTGATRASSAA